MCESMGYYHEISGVFCCLSSIDLGINIWACVVPYRLPCTIFCRTLSTICFTTITVTYTYTPTYYTQILHYPLVHPAQSLPLNFPFRNPTLTIHSVVSKAHAIHIHIIFDYCEQTLTKTVPYEHIASY